MLQRERESVSSVLVLCRFQPPTCLETREAEGTVPTRSNSGGLLILYFISRYSKREAIALLTSGVSIVARLPR